jgi:hypothetical protein
LNRNINNQYFQRSDRDIFASLVEVINTLFPIFMLLHNASEELLISSLSSSLSSSSSSSLSLSSSSFLSFSFSSLLQTFYQIFSLTFCKISDMVFIFVINRSFQNDGSIYILETLISNNIPENLMRFFEEEKELIIKIYEYSKLSNSLDQSSENMKNSTSLFSFGVSQSFSLSYNSLKRNYGSNLKEKDNPIINLFNCYLSALIFLLLFAIIVFFFFFFFFLLFILIQFKLIGSRYFHF